MHMHRYIVVTATTGLATFCDLCYLMIKLPTCIPIQLRGLHTQHISQHRNAFLSHAQPCVSIRVHAYPCVPDLCVSIHVHIYIPYIMYLDTNYKFAASQVIEEQTFPLTRRVHVSIYIYLKGIEGAPDLVKRGEIGASERLSRVERTTE